LSRRIVRMYRLDTSPGRPTGRPPGGAPGAYRSDGRRSMTGRRSGVLELAVLGLLHQSPMHGYELRKRLNAVLGSVRAVSQGSLAPCLKARPARGGIAEEPPPGPRLAGGRSKIVYRLTAEGKERFQDMLAESGPTAWDDETFGVHLAFFGQTDADVRLRILEGRRTRPAAPGGPLRPAPS